MRCITTINNLFEIGLVMQQSMAYDLQTSEGWLSLNCFHFHHKLPHITYSLSDHFKLNFLVNFIALYFTVKNFQATVYYAQLQHRQNKAIKIFYDEKHLLTHDVITARTVNMQQVK